MYKYLLDLIGGLILMSLWLTMRTAKESKVLRTSLKPYTNNEENYKYMLEYQSWH